MVVVIAGLETAVVGESVVGICVIISDTKCCKINHPYLGHNIIKLCVHVTHR